MGVGSLYPIFSIRSSILCGKPDSFHDLIGFGILPPLVVMLKSSLNIRQSLSFISDKGFSDQCRSSHIVFNSFRLSISILSLNNKQEKLLISLYVKFLFFGKKKKETYSARSF